MCTPGKVCLQLQQGMSVTIPVPATTPDCLLNVEVICLPAAITQGWVTQHEPHLLYGKSSKFSGNSNKSSRVTSPRKVLSKCTPPHTHTHKKPVVFVSFLKTVLEIHLSWNSPSSVKPVELSLFALSPFSQLCGHS